MAVFRFLAGLFALVAVIALASDLTPVLELGKPFMPRSLAEHWSLISPKTLAATREQFSGGWVAPFWGAFDAIFLGSPSFALAGGLAVACGYIGRRRREIRVFVN